MVSSSRLVLEEYSSRGKDQLGAFIKTIKNIDFFNGQYNWTPHPPMPPRTVLYISAKNLGLWFPSRKTIKLNTFIPSNNNIFSTHKSLRAPFSFGLRYFLLLLYCPACILLDWYRGIQLFPSCSRRDAFWKKNHRHHVFKLRNMRNKKRALDTVFLGLN